MEYYSDLSQFQAELINAIKNNSEIKVTVKVKNSGASYIFCLTTDQTNITRDIKLSFESDGFYYLEEPLSSYFLRIKQRHIEHLEHEKEIERQDQERKELKALKEKQQENQQENQRMKELSASKHRDEIRLEKILTQLEIIYKNIKSSTLSSGEKTIETWSKGDGEYSEELSLIRVHNADSLNDFFDVLLTETSLYYGEDAAYDSSMQEEDIVYERFDSESRAIERCKDIIIDRQLLN